MTRYFTPVAALALLAACDQADQASEQPVGLANPAATFCIEQGGQYEIQDGENGQSGTCTLPDGSKQDAWEYFRAENMG
ncbi:DUF333 domain-containing protein [Ruegeria sp. R14_0]|uniref:putative hemolysin n=1 Tax=Ruegeria sp. R14_0 TaxID=2821100 RepID=UPI001AD9840B|nr:DUF333 domain-containing protein [Ruegeria sp. R14_0]MBO9446608.1 DUF333 domain-containing protein [Ruegeria sp. R14_0]